MKMETLKNLLIQDKITESALPSISCFYNLYFYNPLQSLVIYVNFHSCVFVKTCLLDNDNGSPLTRHSILIKKE